MAECKAQRGIMIVLNGITTVAVRELTKLMNSNPNITLEYFKEDELLVNITKHELVPAHKLLTEEDKQQLLDRYKLKESQLPRIKLVDPISKYYGLTKGQVVKITRISETAGKYVTYRVVV